MEMETDLILILCTTSSRKSAEQIANYAINKKLAACVNILPNVTSIFFWENKIQKSTEAQIIFKTIKTKSEELIDFIKANHPYNIPEIISIPVDKVNNDYEKWVLDYIK